MFGERNIENRTRKILLRFIKKNPGVSFGELMSTFDLNKGTLRYHLRFLEKIGSIRAEKDGRKKVFFHKGSGSKTSARSWDTAPLDKISSRILALIGDHPGIDIDMISDRLDLGRGEVSDRLSTLRRKRLIWETGNGSDKGFKIITPEAFKDEMMVVLLEKLAKNEIDEELFLELKQRIKRM